MSFLSGTLKYFDALLLRLFGVIRGGNWAIPKAKVWL